MEQKETKTPMEQQADDLNKILGYGSKMKVLWGTKTSTEDDSQIVEDIREIHLTPCALKDIPSMFSKLNLFFDSVSENVMGWSEEKIKSAAEVIFLSTRKMHPDLTENIILEKFGLGGLAKAIRIAMDINDFLSEVTAMNSQLKQAASTLPAQKK